jgi:hypothetical protein
MVDPKSSLRVVKRPAYFPKSADPIAGERLSTSTLV